MEKNQTLGPAQSIYVGAFIGFNQTLTSLPFWTMKTRMQCGYQFSISPKILYKGFGPAVSSITLMSVSQVFCTTTAHRLFYSAPSTNSTEATHSDLNSTQRIFSALTGGAASTIISNPVGVVITQQHKHPNSTFNDTAIHLTKKYGISRFYISFACNSVINSSFTFGFFAAYPILKTSFKSIFPNEIVSTTAASLCTGLLSGIISQPFDTVKTLQEKNADEAKKPLSYYFKTLYKKHGLLKFYTGFIPAVASTTVAATVAGILVEKSENYFLNKK
jgi:hypothetical protein